jgi:CRP/FNR family transcriptional regulator, nitrogen oxide reductase regulator
MAVMADETVSILAGCSLFAGLDAGALEAVRRVAVTRQLARHATLFREGDPADEFMVVLAGRLKLTQLAADGQEVIVRYLGAGEMCVAVAIFAGNTCPATATAVEDSSVLAWRRVDVDAALREYPALALNALKVLSGRLCELQDRVRELSTERVARRIARALLRLVRQVGKRVDDGVLLDLTLSREDLAKLTGTTLFTVSRVLSEWEARGVIATGRERVVIRRPHDLVAIAEDLPVTADGRDGV